MSLAHHETFATAINCMDGRSIRAVMQWFEKELGIQYVDMPTDAGAVKNCDCFTEEDLEKMRFRVRDVSVGMHKSRHVAIVAHEHCAGNPVEKAQQVLQVQKYIDIVRGWFDDQSEIEVFGMWVEPDANGKWFAERIPATSYEIAA